MKKRPLKEFVRFIPGINQSRAKEQSKMNKLNYYDQSSFEKDFSRSIHDGDNHSSTIVMSEEALKEGDIVISNIKQLATMVGKNHAGKILSLNFTKVEFTGDFLDKQYFLYLFNTYKDVRRQKEREIQGNGMIQKITLQSLNEIHIPYVDMQLQVSIGKAYIEMLELQSKLKRSSKLVEQFTFGVLEEKLKED